MELTTEQALQQGVAAHREGNLQEAERFYRGILQSRPKHPDANHNLGVIAAAENQPEAAILFFQTALEAFGPERLLFGSDWPVCLLRTGYDRWFNTVKTAIGELSASEQSAILGGNAERIYQL